MHTYMNGVLTTLICCLLSLMMGCGGTDKATKKNTTANANTPAALVIDTAPYELNPDTNNDGDISDEELAFFIDKLPATAAGMSPPVSALDKYRVVVSGTRELLLPGNKGLLNVWIGDKQFQPAPLVNMVNDVADIAAVGSSAIIQADAPDFDISPAKSECVLLDPSGVNTKFYLSPKHKGEYIVSATVKLYRSNDCSGAAIPKPTKTLRVSVTVNEARIKDDLKQNFIDTFWVQAQVFWKQALIIFFGLLLFLIRKQLKALFGFEQKPNDDE